MPNWILGLSLVGSILAFGGYIWYNLRRAAQSESLDATRAAQEAKIETLNQELLDREYAQRAAEASPNPGPTSTKLLQDSLSPRKPS